MWAGVFNALRWVVSGAGWYMFSDLTRWVGNLTNTPAEVKTDPQTGQKTVSYPWWFLLLMFILVAALVTVIINLLKSLFPRKATQQ
jgi:hypothetical protein